MCGGSMHAPAGHKPAPTLGITACTTHTHVTQCGQARACGYCMTCNTRDHKRPGDAGILSTANCFGWHRNSGSHMAEKTLDSSPWFIMDRGLPFFHGTSAGQNAGRRPFSPYCRRSPVQVRGQYEQRGRGVTREHGRRYWNHKLVTRLEREDSPKHRCIPLVSDMEVNRITGVMIRNTRQIARQVLNRTAYANFRDCGLVASGGDGYWKMVKGKKDDMRC